MSPTHSPLSVSIVVPAYNEETTLEGTVARCLDTLKRCVTDYEVVILDDGSRDGTVGVMEAIRDRHPGTVRTLRHERNRGIAASFEELYRVASKDVVLLIPADGQYPPEALERALPLLATHDIVVFNRTSKVYTPVRMFVSSAYRWLPRLLFGTELFDPGSCKCIRRSLIDEIPVQSRSVFVEAERVIRAVRRGHRVGRVDVVQAERQAGQALGANPRVVMAALGDLVRLWWSLLVLRRAP